MDGGGPPTQSSFDSQKENDERASFYNRPHHGQSVQTFGESNYMEEIPPWLKKPSLFYTLHITYFVVLGFIGAVILRVCPDKDFEHLNFVDALYCSFSALTVTGLLTVRIERLHMFAQVVLLLLAVLGSQIFTSLFPLYARRFAYRKILTNQARSILSKIQDQYHHSSPDLIAVGVNAQEAAMTGIGGLEVKEGNHRDAVAEINEQQSESRENPGAFSQQNYYYYYYYKLKEVISERMRIIKFMWKMGNARRVDCINVLSQKVLRNSLNSEDNLSQLSMEISVWKTRLTEYKALTYLNVIVVAYFLIVQIAGIVLIRSYLSILPDVAEILNRRSVNKTYFAVYNSLASFGNAGFTLLDSSMVPFRQHAFILITLSLIILLGNTMFAPCLRMIIWMLHRLASGAGGTKKEIYNYLLNHPRKCYTHLFPRNQTLWLMVTVMGFNTLQCMFFCLLDWNSISLFGLGPGQKMVDAMFQSAATRNAGSSVVNLADLSPPMLVLFVGMMYIAVYPVYLTRQKTRRPAGLELGESEGDHYEDSKISVQSRKLLARDSAHLFIIVFIVCMIESNNIVQDPLNYSIFNIIFEIISAFGNVGLSVGYSCAALAKSGSASPCQDVPYSLSGKWSTGGKLMIVITMFLGRHRGLPDSIDSALLLPRGKIEDGRPDSCMFMAVARRRLISLQPGKLIMCRLRALLESLRISVSTTKRATTIHRMQMPDHPMLMQTRQPATTHDESPQSSSSDAGIEREMRV
eukprot:Gb_27158 [translate_table: standard]